MTAREGLVSPSTIAYKDNVRRHFFSYVRYELYVYNFDVYEMIATVKLTMFCTQGFEIRIIIHTDI